MWPSLIYWFVIRNYSWLPKTVAYTFENIWQAFPLILNKHISIKVVCKHNHFNYLNVTEKPLEKWLGQFCKILKHDITYVQVNNAFTCIYIFNWCAFADTANLIKWTVSYIVYLIEPIIL